MCTRVHTLSILVFYSLIMSKNLFIESTVFREENWLSLIPENTINK